MIRLAFLLLFTCMLAQKNQAQKQTQPALLKQRAELQKQLAALNKKIEQANAHLHQSAKQRAELQRQITSRKEQMEQLDDQLNAIQNGLRNTDAGLNSMLNRLTNLKKSYAATLILSWKLMNQPEVMHVVFAPGDAQQGQLREAYIKMLRKLQLSQAMQIRELQQEYHLRKQQLGSEQLHANRQLRSQISVTQQLSGREQVIASGMQQIEKTKRNLQLMVKRKTKQQRTIENRLKALVSGTKPPTVKPPDIVVGGKSQNGKSGQVKKEIIAGGNLFRVNKGRLPCPVNGTIVMRFGLVKIDDLIFDNFFLTFATTSEGAPVTAVYAGEISSIMKDEEVFTVLVQHGDIYSVYGNLKSVSVQKGNRVEGGAIIGKTAMSSTSGRSELEFGVYDKRKLVDPEPWINCR